jgi:uncharacterized membrane protein YfcA
MTIKIEAINNSQRDLDNLDLAEQRAISGAGLGAVGGATASILYNKFNGDRVNWKSAGAWAIGGAIAGSYGGWVGAGVAGDD